MPADPARPPEDPRVRFAAERNLLAWIRTGLALMGFGFVIPRFGLFLREMSAADPALIHPRPTSWSLGFGVALVLLGVAVNVLAGLEYRTVIGRIDRGEPYHSPRWSLGLIVAGLLAAVGVAMAGYLLAA
jgi:putative membrane protein